MKASIAFVLCCAVGSALGYYVQRELPYNVGPNDPYAVDPSLFQEPSQRLFWGNQGTNQVGGTGWWATLTNKFPFLGNVFGRMELPNEYGAPQFYQQPPYPQHVYQQQYPQYPQQYPQYPQQYFPQQYSGQNFVPLGGRDVGFTDDSVIITPPQVPIAPAAPQPAPEPAPAGYQYNKPQYRLELPHK